MERESHNKIPQHILVAAWSIALGAIAPMLDSTMVNIAIKQLSATFHTTLSLLQWAITGYILALALAVPISGWLMNKFNGKRVFINAVITFGIISLCVGFSNSVILFIVFRVIQGFSAGIITTLMSTLLVKVAGEAYLGRVIAIVTTPMILGPILGPVLGGVLLQLASWQWLFFINVIVTIVAVPLMMKNLPQFEPFKKHQKLDLVGLLLLAVFTVTIIYGVTCASQFNNFNNKSTVLFMIIGAVMFIAYVIYDRMSKRPTVLPLELFKTRNFAVSSVGLLLANMAILGPMIILPLFFQTFKHYTEIQAAIALIPQGVGMLITRPFIGKETDKYGAKRVLLISIILSLIGSVPLIFITNHTPMIWILLTLFVRGLCVGGIMLPLTSNAYKGLAEEQLPEAGVGVNIIEQLGTTFGTAIIATIVASYTTHIHTSSNHSIVGYHWSFLFAAILLLCIIIPSSLLKTSTKH